MASLDGETSSKSSYPHIPSSSLSQSQSSRYCFSNLTLVLYQPSNHYWFYSTEIDGYKIWWPFNRFDSETLEATFQKTWFSSLVLVSGGLYEINLTERSRKPVYWPLASEGFGSSEVRRTSWFFNSESDPRLLPLSEKMCFLLESKYKESIEENKWNVSFESPSEDYEGLYDVILFYKPECLVLYKNYRNSLTKEISQQTCVLTRGINQELLSSLDPGSWLQLPIEHLFFILFEPSMDSNDSDKHVKYGIETVIRLRQISESLLISHFKNNSITGRIEFIPIFSSIDNEILSQLRKSYSNICHSTLKTSYESRSVLNRLAILFDFSKSKRLVQSTSYAIQESQKHFLLRNPDFKGSISIITHGFMSVPVFELFSGSIEGVSSKLMDSVDEWSVVSRSGSVGNTEDEESCTSLNMENFLLQLTNSVNKCEWLSYERRSCILNELLKGHPESSYSSLSSCFNCANLITLGSPLSLFLSLGSENNLKKIANPNFKLDNCDSFFNVYHPLDPFAFRIEPLLIENILDNPAIIPSYNGRKGLHIELKDGLTKVSSDIKNKVYQSLESTWKSLQQFAYSHINSTSSSECFINEPEMQESVMTLTEEMTQEVLSFPHALNSHRKIDFILQETSSLNTLMTLDLWLHGIRSHESFYWQSYDLVLFLMRQVFKFVPNPQFSVLSNLDREIDKMKINTPIDELIVAEDPPTLQHKKDKPATLIEQASVHVHERDQLVPNNSLFEEGKNSQTFETQQSQEFAWVIPTPMSQSQQLPYYGIPRNQENAHQTASLIAPDSSYPSIQSSNIFLYPVSK